MNKITQKIVIVTIGLVLVAGLVWWYIVMQSAGNVIDTFEECAAKYPVMESYPERCNVPGGKTFTKQY